MQKNFPFTWILYWICQFHQSCGINAREYFHPAAPQQGMLGDLIIWRSASFWSNVLWGTHVTIFLEFIHGDPLRKTYLSSEDVMHRIHWLKLWAYGIIMLIYKKSPGTTLTCLLTEMSITNITTRDWITNYIRTIKMTSQKYWCVFTWQSKLLLK